MEQDSEHQPVLTSAGTTKPPPLFSEGNVDGGIMWQVDKLNSEQIRNKDPPTPRDTHFLPHMHFLFMSQMQIFVLQKFFFLWNVNFSILISNFLGIGFMIKMNDNAQTV